MQGPLFLLNCLLVSVLKLKASLKPKNIINSEAKKIKPEL
jgi:hypothetical protein